jgi:hypothetical protein
MGHFQTVENQGPEGSDLLNHQEVLINQDLSSTFRATGEG